MRGAVARLAEDAFGQLDERQQELARGVLMRLASEGEAGGVERRRVPLAELETESNQKLAQAVALLTDRRLLTASAGSIELAHEALLREWPRLRGWIEENREGLRIHRALGAAAREWQGLDRDDGALYRGTRLTESLEWAAENPDALNAVERELLRDSAAERDRERAARRRRIVVAFSGLGVVLVALAAVAIIAVAQSREAERKRDAAASRELAARSASLLDSDPRLGLAVSLAALGRRDTEQARSAVRQATLVDRTLRTQPMGPGAQFAYSVVPSRDGKRLVTASEGGSVGVWDVASGRRLSTIKGDSEAAVSAGFSPDGTRVASVGADGDVAITDADGGDRHVLLRLVNEDPALSDFARSVEFSPDGRRLLIATVLGKVGVLAAGERRTSLRLLGTHEDRAKASFDSSGTRAVSASRDRTATIWRLTGPSRIVLRHPAGVNFAVFDPAGSRVATAAEDGRVRIWNAADGRLVRTILVADARLGSVRFSPDGRRIVTSGADGVVRVSAVAGGPPLNELRGAGPANDATFVPGTDEVSSVGEDGTLRTWSLLAVDQFLADDGQVPYKQPAFSPDGRHVVSGYDEGGVRLWDVASGASTQLPGRFEDATEVRYSGDGRHIVAASIDGKVRIWDAAGRRARIVPSDDNQKFAIAVDARARRIAIAAQDADPVVEGPDGSGLVKLGVPKGAVTALAFSPDAKNVISAGDDGVVRIWPAAGPRACRRRRDPGRDLQRRRQAHRGGWRRRHRAHLARLGRSAGRALRPRGRRQHGRVQPRGGPPRHRWQGRDRARLGHALRRRPRDRQVLQGRRTGRRVQLRRQARPELGRARRGAANRDVRAVRLVRVRPATRARAARAQARQRRASSAAVEPRLTDRASAPRVEGAARRVDRLGLILRDVDRLPGPRADDLRVARDPQVAASARVGVLQLVQDVALAQLAPRLEALVVESVDAVGRRRADVAEEHRRVLSLVLVGGHVGRHGIDLRNHGHRLLVGCMVCERLRDEVAIKTSSGEVSPAPGPRRCPPASRPPAGGARADAGRRAGRARARHARSQARSAGC